MMAPANSSGTVISTDMTGSSKRRLGNFHGFLEGDASGHLERQVVRIDVVVRTVVEDDPEIDHREAGQVAAPGGVANAFFDGRNEVLRNGAAEDVVDELELAAARQRLHLDLAVAVLAVAAGLLLVAALHVGLAADGLAVRDLGRLQVDLGVIALLELRDDDFNVLLPGAGDQEFLGLRIAEEAQHGIFFHELVDPGPELVFVGAALGFDREGDRGLGQRDPRILNGCILVAQRVAGERVAEFGNGADVARRAVR